MNRLSILAFTVIIVFFISCEQNPRKISNQGNVQKLSNNQLVEQKSIVDKFLIAENSVGFFKIGCSWQEIAKKDYGYEAIQSSGRCVDACCDGGFILGNKIIEGENGKTIESHQITIGSLRFDESESEDKHKNNPEVFYVSSDNCKGWYWKDKSKYIIVDSEMFKTEEDVGVGISLEKVLEKYGKLNFEVGWIEEDDDALQVVVEKYPNISFILDVDDYKGHWEEIYLKAEENTLDFSDFKETTKIKRVILHGKN